MRKRKEKTSKAEIISALRRVWLYGPERRAAVQRDSYKCQRCHKRQTRSKKLLTENPDEYFEKMKVHHKVYVKLDGTWDDLINSMFCHQSNLECLCEKCHNEEHGRTGGGNAKGDQK